jgi:hypothetical protein
MSPSRITTSPLREPHCDITDEEFQELYDKVLKDIVVFDHSLVNKGEITTGMDFTTFEGRHIRIRL